MGRPLEPPHSLMVDGALFADPAARFANLHFVRTEFVPEESLKRCTEVRNVLGRPCNGAKHRCSARLRSSPPPAPP